MLTRWIDALDYFLVNANDGASGVGSAESAATYEYDTVAFDCDAVNIEHPYTLVAKGDTVWEHLKDIGNASICYYLGMSPDGIFTFKNRYAEAGVSTPESFGAIDNVGAIDTSLETEAANSIKVEGVIINKATALETLFTGTSAALTTNSGGALMHPIEDATYLTVQGATTIECAYQEKES
jgi:hypothetical protein